ncbi:MAG TPA: Rad52/Rad22 family DNA repair protein [Pyrinomonadaceae bacterium]
MSIEIQQKREKKAKAIQAMGLVDREGDHFRVFTPSIKGHEKWFEVRRNEAGAVICDCPEFTSQSGTSGFRCAHIMAVKFALLAQQEAAAGSSGVNDRSESRASKRGEQEPMSAIADVSSAGRDENAKAKQARLGATQGEIEMKQSDLKEAEVKNIQSNGDSARASNVLDFSTTLQELRRNVDPRLVKQREGWRDRNGNVQTVDYVEWHTVADILDDVAPHWTHTVKNIEQIGDIMTVTVAITIDGVTREGIGTGNAHNEMGIKKAEHDALKRAAVKFGIARDLYKKESDVIERDGSLASRDDEEGFPTQPVARNLGELVTAKQLGMIRALARELRIDADEECNSVMSCRTDELSKSAASSFIKHLQDMQRPVEVERVPLRRAS